MLTDFSKMKTCFPYLCFICVNLWLVDYNRIIRVVSGSYFDCGEDAIYCSLRGVVTSHFIGIRALAGQMISACAAADMKVNQFG